MDQLNEIAIKKIPKGIYCYERLEPIEGTNRLKVINHCPFYSFNEYLGLHRCDFLGLYGIPNYEGDIPWSVLIEYFGSEEKLFEASPLDLLFDSVKECGINTDLGNED